MHSDYFAQCCAREKDELLSRYFEPGSESSVATTIATLGLTPSTLQKLREVLDAALTEYGYTLLLGIDGAASLGGRQRSYELRDEEGNDLASGKLEAAAWSAFHERSK